MFNEKIGREGVRIGAVGGSCGTITMGYGQIKTITVEVSYDYTLSQQTDILFYAASKFGSGNKTITKSAGVDQSDTVTFTFNVTANEIGIFNVDIGVVCPADNDSIDDLFVCEGAIEVVDAQSADITGTTLS